MFENPTSRNEREYTVRNGIVFTCIDQKTNFFHFAHEQKILMMQMYIFCPFQFNI